jgi:uncharacterized coiled-coil protein SlyX
MQWLINRFEAFKKEVTEKLEKALAEHSSEVQKLKGEISALKARMGKKPE